MPSQPFHPESWPRLRALLDELLQLEAEQRPRFLANLEERDAHLRPELERLLAEALALENTPSLTAMDLAVPAVRADLTEQLDLDEERVGQCVGPYRLLRMLGAGGMGVVYLAERDAGEFTHRVAMKLLRTAASNRALKDRFDRERQILASLKHPGIAALFDGGHTEDGQAFYTMEFVDGLPVTEYAYTHLPTVSERIDLLLQIAHALAYAHQNLVVHRDIKPSNVLVDTTGQVKLVDFGLAKLLQPAAPAVMTQAGTMPMTPAYAAPEQFHSDVITVATDIYQFGILCFVVLAGRLPYRADPNDALAWARAVTEEAPMTLCRAFQLANPARDGSAGRYQRALSRDLDAIIGKALAKEPSMRFGSIDAMISDLRAFAEGRPVAARRAGPVYLMSRFIARHPYGVAATVGAFIALASTALVATNQSRIAAAEADRANAVSSFLVGLFQVADPSINRGEHLSANQILEKGSERINREMASQPAERARLQSVIGEVYAVLGEYGRARDALDPAIAVMSSTSSTDSTDLAHALNWRAFISATDGDYKAALAMLDRAAGLLTENTPRQQDELATLHARRASAYNHLNDYAAARREYETAIRLRDELGQTSTLKMAGIHNNYGTMLRAINEQALARREFSKALEIFSAQEGDPEKSYFVMGARMNLATALIDLGDLEAARTMLERASNFFRAMTGKANVAYANAENKLGEIERLSHRIDEAYAHYNAAEEAYRSALGDHNYQVASPMQNRGEAALDDGQYEKALSEFTRALALRRESLPDSRREIASALHGRGQALIGLARYDDARQDLATALDVWTKTLPPNHPMIVYAFFDLARADAALGNVEAAESERLEAERRASIAFIDNPARLRAFQTAVKDLSRNATVQMGSYDE